MDTIHFSKLKEFAVKDKVERGQIYVYCFDSLGQASTLLTASGLVNVPRIKTVGRNISEIPKSKGSYWRERILGFWELTPMGFLQWHYATDSGLVAGGYGNYMLDRLALLREGIHIDMSKVEGPYDYGTDFYYSADDPSWSGVRSDW